MTTADAIEALLLQLNDDPITKELPYVAAMRRIAEKVAELVNKETPMTAALQAELDRAHALHGDCHHLPDGTGASHYRDAANTARDVCDTLGSAATWRHILTEEFWEALAESDPDLLTAELLQVATVALRWVDAIAARGQK